MKGIRVFAKALRIAVDYINCAWLHLKCVCTNIDYKLFTQVIVFILLWVNVILCCFQFSKWNKVPYNSLVYKVKTMGNKVSSMSSTQLSIFIEAGHYGESFESGKNLLYINHDTSSDSLRRITIYPRFYDIFSDVYQLYKEDIDGMNTLYLLDVNYFTNMDCKLSRDVTDDRSKLPDAYITKPIIYRDENGTSIGKSGFYGYKEKEGTGKLDTKISTVNQSPHFWSNYDVTQCIYSIIFKGDYVNCKSLSIKFGGAVNLSQMFPEPDNVTMNSIEFTKPESLQTIGYKGVKFRAEFIELKEMAATRNFVLTAILSLAISFIASIMYSWIFTNRKK